MQVRERCGGMVRFLHVDVKEGRLKEAPEKSDNAQNCVGCPHECLSNLSLNRRSCCVLHLISPRGQGSAHAPGEVWATAGFGWYVRNIASYSVLYQSVATSITLLAWMYLMSLIALLGCEFNAECERMALWQSGALY